MKRTRVSRTYLIVDARERAVIPFIETEFKEHAFVVKQVTTADYLVCRMLPVAQAPAPAEAVGAAQAPAQAQPEAVGAAQAPAQAPAQAQAAKAVVLAAVERKSHEDFAASFKDGRHENVKKLLALRAATGCQLYYIVEGPAFPSRDAMFGGVPFGHILAAITMLMVCDGIFVVQTENAAHSARRLADLVRAFDSGLAPPGPALVAPEILAVPDILTARAEETDDEAAVCMWACLGGVSVVTGRTLTRAFTVAELAAQSVTLDQIRALKTEAGRPINKDAVASLIGVRAGSLELAVKLVSGVRGITPPVARLLLDATGGLSGLCTHAGLAAVQLPQKSRSVKFGDARAARVQRSLNYRAQ